MWPEKFATSKHPIKGKCKKSPFMNGYHRAGWIDTSCAIDGGAPGNHIRVVCLECGKAFKRTAFVLIDQPRRAGISKARGEK